MRAMTLAFPDSKWSDSIPNLVRAKLIQTFENAGYSAPAATAQGLTADRQLLTDIRTFRVSSRDSPAAAIDITAKIVSTDGQVSRGAIVPCERAGGEDGGRQPPLRVNQAFAKVATDLVIWAFRPHRLKRMSRNEISGSPVSVGWGSLALPSYWGTCSALSRRRPQQTKREVGPTFLFRSAASSTTTFGAFSIRLRRSGANPAFPSTGLSSTRNSWRCVTCHGWDYSGTEVGGATLSEPAGFEGDGSVSIAKRISDRSIRSRPDDPRP